MLKGYTNFPHFSTVNEYHEVSLTPLTALTLSLSDMSIQNDHGRWGEAVALEYLTGQGLQVVEQNWRYKRAEIDLIAMEDKTLVFIEVKTRANSDFGLPEEMVNKRKQRLVIDAAQAYMRSIGHEWEIRFDIVSILGSPGAKPEIKHFRDAFFPGLDYHL